jgi:tetratricopeptide (TPR) repeat protein
MKPATRLRVKLGLILAGLCAGIFLLEAGLRMGGAVILALQERRNLESLGKEGAYRVLCLGESTTQRGYPQMLAEVLARRRNDIVFSVVNRGVSGITSDDILARLGADLARYRPQAVIVMMGINDRGEHMPWGSDMQRSRRNPVLKHSRVYKLLCLLGRHLEAGGWAGGYLARADSYRRAGNLDEEARVLASEIAKHPQNDVAYSLLGRCYRKMGEFRRSEEALREAIRLNPTHAEWYRHLGKTFQEEGDYPQAEQALVRALKSDPAYFDAWLLLARVYELMGRFSESEAAYKHAAVLDPGKARVYGALGALAQRQGRHDEATQWFRKAGELSDGYAAYTAENFRRLKRALDARGIRMVCVQYPMREVSSLRALFDDPHGIIFVDNERAFREAVEKEGYDAYFEDAFAGDFGHCTRKGNLLLAERIADALLPSVPIAAEGDGQEMAE